MKIERIVFEENDERIKVIIPIERQPLYWGLYSTMLLTWIVGSIWGVAILISFLIQGDFGFSGIYLVAYLFILGLIGIFWFYLGKKVWTQWQYFSATREILFFYAERLIIRRPVSLLGITDAYSREHVSRFSLDKKLNCPAFDYGNFRVPVGMTLPVDEGKALIAEINSRFYANIPEEDEDDY
ncbi:MAG: signal transduction histidine kinase [Cellvibrionaceae bacterium]|jgi:signal transduction histidine kinase